MRILHFTNIPLNIDVLKSSGKELNTSGGWMAALLGEMLKQTDFTFCCIAFGDVKEVQESHIDRVISYTVPGDLVGRSIDKSLAICKELVDEWQPDLIHIHGTEAAYGLLTANKMVKYPAIISLQGLLGPYSSWYHSFGNLSFIQILKTHRLLEILTGRGVFWRYLQIRNMAKREKRIIAQNHHFMGRTDWDRAYIKAINPSATYHYGGEILRKPFSDSRWDLQQSQRYRIIFTNAGAYPRKGTEVLLDAVKLLKPRFPDIEVAIAGHLSNRSGYGRYIRKRIEELGSTAVELGPLNAEQMADELVKSHVFVSPSFIDNSPNSVCEAQLIGMPVVSSYTGGVPSLIEEGKTGLFFPAGDVPMLASRLEKIFENDGMATALGQQANEVAAKRHDPASIVKDVVNAYEAILDKTFTTCGSNLKNEENIH